MLLTKNKELEFFITKRKFENEYIETLGKEFRDKIECLKDVIHEVLSENTFLNITKIEFGENWRLSCKMLAYPYEIFKKLEGYNFCVIISKRRLF